MFISKLVEKANKSTNTDEVTKIRKKLIHWGLAGIFIGAFGVMISMMISLLMFISSMNVNAMHYDFYFVIPACFSIPLGGCIWLGILSLLSGISLVVVQKTSEFIDDNVYCPVCNHLTGNDRYCSKCGASVINDRICEHCKALNDVDSKYCKDCGKEV